MIDVSADTHNSFVYPEEYKAMIDNILLKVYPLSRMINKYGHVVPEGEGYDEQEAKQFVSKTIEDIVDDEGDDEFGFNEDDSE